MIERPEDRRTEKREGSRAGVLLRTAGRLPREVKGRLVDVSFGGFRARHADHDLSVGDRVGFSHTGREGEAVVVWTRIAQGSIESGFRILSA